MTATTTSFEDASLLMDDDPLKLCIVLRCEADNGVRSSNVELPLPPTRQSPVRYPNNMTTNPGQLAIPLKASRPVDLRGAVKKYIETQHPETHPDAFKADVNQWEALRKDTTPKSIKATKLQSLQLYHAQLVFILTKLPADIRLNISYDPAFPSTSSSALTLSNLCYERLCVLFNLAALYSQIARSQNLATVEGIRLASNYYQHAAGVLSQIIESALPQLQATYGQPLPSDMTAPFFLSLQLLMLAQAQECALEKSIMDSGKAGLMARVAVQISDFYNSAYETTSSSSPSISDALPAEWRSYMQVKALHYEAFAQHKKSADDSDAGKHGDAVTRMEIAVELAKRGFDISRRSRELPQTVKSAISTLLTNSEKVLATITKENDYIYHKDVPAPSGLPVLQGAALVKPKTPKEVSEPGLLVGPSGAQPIFGDLLAHGAQLAVELYKDRRSNFLKEEILDVQREGDAEIASTLRRLHLPAAIEALDKNPGLPASLLNKAKEIREEGGNEHIEKLIDDIENISNTCSNVLEEIMNVLDEEAEKDDEYQNASRAIGLYLRSPSHEANGPFTQRAENYLAAMAKAAASDSLVRNEWLLWEDTIDTLSGPEEEMEASVPSVRLVDLRRANGSTTQRYSRALIDIMEQLEDLKADRQEAVRTAQRVAADDDIRPRIQREAAGVERWVEITASMFENTITSELQKYDQYRGVLAKDENKQAELLQNLEETNSEFLQSRKDDPVIKLREEAMYKLDEGYQKYRETVGNLTDGLRFYNEMVSASQRLLDEAKQFVAKREVDVRVLTEMLKSTSIQEDSSQSIASSWSNVSSQNANYPDAVQASTPSSFQHVSPPPVPDAQPSQNKAPQTSAISSVSSSQSTPWQPRSNFVRSALAVSVPGPREDVTPSMEVDAEESQSSLASSSIPSPWKETVYARELNDAEWEESPVKKLSKTPVKQKYARELGNLDDDDGWEDGIVATSPLKAKTTNTKAKTPKKPTATAPQDSSAATRSAKTPRTRSRLPA